MKFILRYLGSQVVKDACESSLSVFLDKYRNAADYSALFYVYNNIRKQHKIPEARQFGELTSAAISNKSQQHNGLNL